jgi:hypothetical protein
MEPAVIKGEGRLPSRAGMFLPRPRFSGVESHQGSSQLDLTNREVNCKNVGFPCLSQPCYISADSSNVSYCRSRLRMFCHRLPGVRRST